MLLNEFLKEHRRVEQLEAALDALNKRMNAQDSKIQEVTDDIRLSKPVSKVVSDH